MSDFSRLINNGLKKIREQDIESYRNYLQIVADVREISVEALERADAFFVPNDDYLARWCGDEIRSYEYDCYSEYANCKWSNQLVVPIYNVADEVVAFGGFNPFLYVKAKEGQRQGFNYYQYSGKQLFQKGRYVYSPKGMQCKAMQDGYVCVVDGLFDAVSLAHEGFNVYSLMGSSLTPEIITQLKMVKQVILVCDNDDAGVRLQNRLVKVLKDARVFRQGKYKDIDECLKSEHRDEIVERLHDCILGYI